ncbi:NAD(P)H-dependent flavin oxidoreductase [Candidatus Blastococcus massiliensis]|uniref:NAD(P)H-dependent flavin oxidoreductase n=1 Tax=Candidatus Blastococcus massiliensis TaxID=1470358 RepID=UPI0004AF92E5|nr:nitronate monooxygenase family protein [Candidatus Blastococcus massiliensis]
MRTAATDLVGIDVPIFAFSHCRDVVAAVTNAGGLGVLGAVAHTPEQLDIDLAWIEQEVKGRPYGVDLLVPGKFAGAEAGGLDREALGELLPAEHRQWLDGMLDRYGIPPLPADAPSGGRSSGVGGMRVDPKSMAPLLDVLFAHETKLVASALGPPPPHFIERAHGAGIPVAALAGSVEHAIRHKAAGADLVVAQGTEAGGHTGQIATMVLVPEVVDAVGPLPVLAAGGIGRGRQLAAGMALGADGVWCGSVWLTTEEAETNPAVKEKFLRAGLGDTVRSRSMTGKPARMLRSPWTEEWESTDGPGTLPMPLQPMLVGEALARINRVADKPGTPANDLATYFVGQIVGSASMSSVRPARRVVLEMVEEFVDAVERLNGLAAS